MADKKTRLESIELSGYSKRDYSERQEENVIYFGEDNSFPNYLVELYNESPTHRALCTTIGLMIYGDGFTPQDLDARLLYESWNFDEELRKAALDLKLFSGFALEINWSLDRETIARVSHLPFENVRSGCANEEEVVETFFYSRDWTDNAIEPTPFPRFNTETKIEHPVQIMYVKPFSPGSYYYPKPDYVGAINYIELEREISTFHINNIKNGLAPSMAIHFANGDPSDEEQNAIRAKIEQQATGAHNAGKFFLTFSDLPEQKPSIDTFQLSDADKQYQFLSEETTAKIMIGHRVTSPENFGVAVPGKLGTAGTGEAADLFEEQVIEPYREILVKACKKIYGACGIQTQIGAAEAQAEVKAEQSFTGIQISSAIDVITKTKTGELDTAQARQILISMLGFTPEAVDNIFKNQEATAANLSAEKFPEEAFSLLEDVGEEIGDDWELIDSREVDYDSEDTLDALFTFARVPSSNPSGKSSQDSELIKVRYAYAPGTADEKSRDFCRKMVNAGKVYRKEDILAASERAVNPGWGARGADTYNLWLYKGGGSCRHFWERRTYLRRDNKKLSVSEARAIINSVPAAERSKYRLPVNEKEVAQRPRDMVNRGFLEPRKFSTPR